MSRYGPMTYQQFYEGQDADKLFSSYHAWNYDKLRERSNDEGIKHDKIRTHCAITYFEYLTGFKFRAIVFCDQNDRSLAIGHTCTSSPALFLSFRIYLSVTTFIYLRNYLST